MPLATERVSGSREPDALGSWGRAGALLERGGDAGGETERSPEPGKADVRRHRDAQGFPGPGRGVEGRGDPQARRERFLARRVRKG